VGKFDVVCPPEEATAARSMSSSVVLAKARSMVALALRGTAVVPPPADFAPPTASEPLSDAAAAAAPATAAPPFEF
jgi:hypothetical protein